jgi:hypothetical protein
MWAKLAMLAKRFFVFFLSARGYEKKPSAGDGARTRFCCPFSGQGSGSNPQWRFDGFCGMLQLVFLVSPTSLGHQIVGQKLMQAIHITKSSQISATHGFEA